MALRSFRERVLQTLSYEAGGLLIATPLYSLIAGHDASSSGLLVFAVAVACMLWSPLHNTGFDWLEWRLAKCVASQRPHGRRVLHAISHEVTSIVITTPLIMLVGGHGLIEALLVDIGLTVLYSVYAYFFHILYDWVRPVAVVEVEHAAVVIAHEPRLVSARPVRRSRSDAGEATSGASRFLTGAVVI